MSGLNRVAKCVKCWRVSVRVKVIVRVEEAKLAGRVDPGRCHHARPLSLISDPL